MAKEKTAKKTVSNARKIGKTLTRKELIDLVAARSKQKTSEVSDYVDTTIDSLASLLSSADSELRIELRGLGVFEVKYMKERATVRDPRTGERLTYKGRRRKIHYRPSKVIKRALLKENKTKHAKV